MAEPTKESTVRDLVARGEFGVLRAAFKDDPEKLRAINVLAGGRQPSEPRSPQIAPQGGEAAEGGLSTFDFLTTPVRALDVPRQAVLAAMAGVPLGRATGQVMDPRQTVTADEAIQRKFPGTTLAEPRPTKPITDNPLMDLLSDPKGTAGLLGSIGVRTAVELLDPLLLTGLKRPSVKVPQPFRGKAAKAAVKAIEERVEETVETATRGGIRHAVKGTSPIGDEAIAPGPVGDPPILSAADPDKVAPSIARATGSGDPTIDAILEEAIEQNRLAIATGRGGVIPDAVVQDLGSRLSLEKAFQGQPGNIDNAVQAAAVKQLSTKEGLKLNDKIIEFLKNPSAETEAAAIEQSMFIAKEFLPGVSRVTADPGRTLRAFKKQPGEVRLTQKQLLEFSKESDNQRKLQLMLKDFREGRINVNDPLSVVEYIAQQERATNTQMLLEAWQNGLLGPATWMANDVSNVITAGFRPLERSSESISAMARGDFKEAKDLMTMTFWETWAMGQGIRDATRAALHFALEGPNIPLPEKPPGVFRLAGQGVRAVLPGGEGTAFGKARRELGGIGGVARQVSKEGTLLGEGSAAKALRDLRPQAELVPGARFDAPTGAIRGGKILDPLGRIVRGFGFRQLGVRDEFFKVIHHRATLSREAMRKALDATRGQDFFGSTLPAYKKWLKAPNEEMYKLANQDAVYRTFQTKFTEGFGKTLLQAKATHPFLGFIIPFVTTPLNLVKFGIERTPFQLIELSRKAAKAPRGEKLAAFTDEAIGKMMVGTGLMISAYMGAESGRITGGGPTDRSQRNVSLTREPKYSIRFGNQWFDYRRLEPLAPLFGLPADLRTMINEGEEVDWYHFASAVWPAVVRNVNSKLMIQPVAEALEALVDEEGSKAEAFAARLLGSFAPIPPLQSLSTSTSRAIDPTIRSAAPASRVGFAENLRQRAANKIPFFRGSVPPVLNIWGEEVMSLETGLERFTSPIRRRAFVRDPATEAVSRLGIGIGFPKPKLRIRGVDIPMTEKEYADLRREIGRHAKEFVTKVVTDPTFARLPEEFQKKLVKSQISAAQKLARAKAMGRKAAVLR